MVTRDAHVLAPIGDGISVVEYRSHGGSARGGENIGVVQVAMSAGLKTKAGPSVWQYQVYGVTSLPGPKDQDVGGVYRRNAAVSTDVHAG